MNNNSNLTKEELLIKINQLESKVSELEVSLETTFEKQAENNLIENNPFINSELLATNHAINKKKEVQEALKQSEAIVRNKLKAITELGGDIGELELSDIIDVEVLQSMMNDFYQLTGMLGAVLDVSGKVLVAVGWQDICTKFHRCNKETLKNCIESDTKLTQGVPEGTFKAYRCKNNMWDIVTPIIVGEKHVGNVFMGQYFLDEESPDIDFFKSQAKKYGFNEKEYIAALSKVPRFTKEDVQAGMEFYSKLSKLISNHSYSTIQQSRLLAEQKKSEQALQESKERFELAMAAAKDGIYDWNIETNEIYYSPGWKSMLGYTDNELPNDFSVWEKLTDPKDVERSWKMLQDVIDKKRDRFEMESRIKHKNGHWVDVLSRAEAVFNDKGTAIRMVGTYVDISERKLEEKILAIELKLFEYAVNHSEDELLQKFIDEAEELTKSTIGFYHYIEENQESISLQTWSSNTINSMCNRSPDVDYHYPISKAGVWVDCIKERKPVIHNDYVNLAHKKGLPEGHAPVVRELVVPVLRGNQVVAVLGVGNKKTDYNESDVKIVQRLADLAWETAIRKQAEEKLKNTFDISPSIIAKVNLNTGYFIEANNAVNRILGYSINELISKPLMEFIHPDDRQKTVHEISIRKNGNQGTFFENRYLCKDGTYKWMAWHGTEADKNGIVISIGSDITDRKNNETQLIESEKKYRELVNLAQEGIWVLDKNNITSFANPSMAQMLKYSPEEMIGKSLFDFMDEDGKKIANENLERRKAGLKDQHDFEFICKNGSRVFCTITTAPILDNSNNYNGAIAGVIDITEHKIALLKLSQSTKLLEASQSIAKLGGWELNLSNNKLFWTDETYRIHDTSPEEFNPTVDAGVEYFLPESRCIISNALEAAITNGKGYDLELETYTTKGRKISVRTTCEVTFLNGKPIKLMGIFQDITAQKKAQNKIRTAEDNLKNTFDLSPSIICKANLETGYFIEANKAVTRILGYTIEEYTSIPFIELIHPNDQQKSTNEKTDQLKGKDVTFFENRYLCKDGSYKWMAWHGTKADENGIVTAIGSDITERKLIEEETKKNQYLLIKSEEISNQGAWEWDLIQNKWTCSKNWFHMHGCQISNIKHEELMGLSHPEDIHIIDKAFQDAINGIAPYDIEHRIIRKNDGEVRYLRAKGNIIYNDTGQRIKMYGVSQDITEQKVAEDKLNEALEKALESDRLKSAFLSNMSHEIRTPMNGILGFINLLNKPNLSQSQISEYSAIINKSGDRLLNTINDIIDISKIEAGEVVISNTETSINTEIEELYAFFLPEANRKGLSLLLKPSISVDNLTVNTDNHKLHGILTNLIKNAIKYTNKGSVTLGYSIKNNFIEFFVKDTGIGIPKNRLQAIFNRFEQADIDDANVFEGSGLGLAIAKAYTNMLGGKISVESTDGIGSTFKFTVPHNRKETIEMEKQSDYIENTTSRIEHLNLLIVEDDIVSSYFLETILEKDFKKINIVENGIEAIEYCKNNQEIDLVLMDIKMPIMNGYEATKEIRKFNKELLIIAQTAYALHGDKEKAIEAGCNDYIVKPINKELLLKTIDKLIN